MATTTNFGWETPDDTDLVKDGALAMRTLGNSIDTSFVDLKGGTTGQVLSKASNTDLDFTWVAQDDSNAIQNAIIDAKGDLIVGTAADTPARLAVGTNGHVLTADSSTASGLKWAAAAGGGKVLQVVSTTYDTSVEVASTTYADTGLSLSITPSATTSKILVLGVQSTYHGRSATSSGVGVRLLRGTTAVWTNSPARISAAVTATGATFIQQRDQMPIIYLDSPSTSSSVTYKTQGAAFSTDNSGTSYFQESGNVSTLILVEIGA